MEEDPVAKGHVKQDTVCITENRGVAGDDSPIIDSFVHRPEIGLQVRICLVDSIHA